jgi:hypothetical protein
MDDLRKKSRWMFVLEVLIYLAVAISISFAITQLFLSSLTLFYFK